MYTRKMLESYVTGIAKPVLLFRSLPNTFVLQAGNKNIQKQLQETTATGIWFSRHWFPSQSESVTFCNPNPCYKKEKGEKGGNILLPSVILLLQQCFKIFYKIILIKTLWITAMSRNFTVGESLSSQLIAYQRHQEDDLLQESYELRGSGHRCFQRWQTDQTLIPGVNSWFCPLPL